MPEAVATEALNKIAAPSKPIMKNRLQAEPQLIALPERGPLLKSIENVIPIISAQIKKGDDRI